MRLIPVKYYSPAYGLGNAGVRTNKDQTGAAPTVTAANNGLSLSGTTAQIGQAVGAVGNPAALLNDREIPLGGNDFAIGISGDRRLLIDVANSIYQFGDIDGGAGSETHFTIDDANREARIKSLGLNFLFIDVDNNNHGIGDLDGGATGTKVIAQGSTSTAYLNGAFTKMGDVESGGNDFVLTVNDSGSIAHIKKAANHFFLVEIPLGVYQLGDIDGSQNGTFFEISDTNQAVKISSGGSDYMSINITTGLYGFGDFDGSNNGTAITIDDGTGNIQLFAGTLTNAATALLDAATKTFSVVFNGGAGQGGIKTNAPSATGAGLWLLGKNVAAAVAFDATQYIETMIDGVVYKLALAV